MSKNTELKTRLKKFTPAPVAVGVGLVSLTGTASAAVMSEVTTALSNGQETLTAIAGGLVLMAVVMLGLGLTIKALQRKRLVSYISYYCWFFVFVLRWLYRQITVIIFRGYDFI